MRPKMAPERQKAIDNSAVKWYHFKADLSIKAAFLVAAFCAGANTDPRNRPEAEDAGVVQW